MYEETKEQAVENAKTEDLQPLHDRYLEVEALFKQFKSDHYRGVVNGDVNAARRRARVVSSELGKQLKDYRMLSNEHGKNK